MKPKIRIITACIDCPFCEKNVDDPYCIIDSIEIYLQLDENNNPITPNWCPLKKQPILVTYEQ